MNYDLIYFIGTSIIVFIAWLVSLIQADTQAEKRKVFPYFIAIPFGCLIVPFALLASVIVLIVFLIVEWIPNKLFPDKKL